MLPLNYFLFLQIIIFLFITPGTPRIVIVSYSMNYGVQKCIWTALGDITANIIQATLVIFVLGSFFSDNPNFLSILNLVVTVYRGYLYANFELICFMDVLKVSEPPNKTSIELAQLLCSRLREGCEGEKCSGDQSHPDAAEND